MKSNIIKLLMLSMAVLALFSCKKENELAYSPNPQGVVIKVGEQAQLKVESFGVKSDQGYDVTNATWSIADPFYATIDASGVVTGKKVGATTAVATFDGGKLVMCDVVVYSDNVDYDEPDFESSNVPAIVKSELLFGRIATRVGSDYAIFRNENDETKAVNPYVMYFLGDVKGQVSVLTPSNFDHVVSTFLPDRYEGGPENFTSPTINALANNNPYGPAVIYNTSDVNALLSRYKDVSRADIETVANPDNYTSAALKTVLPFDVSGVDASAVNTAKGKALGLLNNANVKSFNELETEVGNDYETIYDLYLETGRVWALNEWCYKAHSTPVRGGLRKGHDQTQYSATAWARVLELDELATDAFASDETFKGLDDDAVAYGSKYSDVATLANMTTFCKNIDDGFAKLEASNKSNYSEDCWSTVVALKDAAKDSINNKMYSYSEISLFVPTVVASDMTSDASYFHDVITKAQTIVALERLNAILSNYKQADYTTANWNRIMDRYNSTKAFVEDCCSVESVNISINDAKSFFDSVPKK